MLEIKLWYSSGDSWSKNKHWSIFGLVKCPFRYYNRPDHLFPFYPYVQGDTNRKFVTYSWQCCGAVGFMRWPLFHPEIIYHWNGKQRALIINMFHKTNFFYFSKVAVFCTTLYQQIATRLDFHVCVWTDTSSSPSIRCEELMILFPVTLHNSCFSRWKCVVLEQAILQEIAAHQDHMNKETSRNVQPFHIS